MTAPLFTGLNHICIVTNNIDRAVRIWSDRCGVGPWSLYTKDASNMSSRAYGKPIEFSMRVALGQVSPSFRIEIIQPLDDRSPYATSLLQHQGADHIHHVSLKVASYRDATERLDRLGFDKPLQATFSGAPGITSCFEGTYFSTENDLGFIVEVGHAPADFVMPAPESVYPPPSA